MATSAEPDQLPPTIAVSSRDGIRMVELAGAHDVTTSAKVRAAIRGDNHSRGNVVLSLEHVTFLDSAIVGLFFTSSRSLAERGNRLVVHCPRTTPIRKLLRLAQFSDIGEVTETLQEAIDRTATA